VHKLIIAFLVAAASPIMVLGNQDSIAAEQNYPVAATDTCNVDHKNNIAADSTNKSNQKPENGRNRTTAWVAIGIVIILGIIAAFAPIISSR
jgi:hypothetical protein